MVQSFIDAENNKWDCDIIHDIDNDRDGDLIKWIPIPFDPWQKGIVYSEKLLHVVTTYKGSMIVLIQFSGNACDL